MSREKIAAQVTKEGWELFSDWLVRRPQNLSRLAGVIGVHRTTLWRILQGIVIPVPATQAVIERVTHGYVPVSAWTRKLAAASLPPPTEHASNDTADGQTTSSQTPSTEPDGKDVP